MLRRPHALMTASINNIPRLCLESRGMKLLKTPNRTPIFCCTSFKQQAVAFFAGLGLGQSDAVRAALHLRHGQGEGRPEARVLAGVRQRGLGTDVRPLALQVADDEACVPVRVVLRGWCPATHYLLHRVQVVALVVGLHQSEGSAEAPLQVVEPAELGAAPRGGLTLPVAFAAIANVQRITITDHGTLPFSLHPADTRCGTQCRGNSRQNTNRRLNHKSNQVFLLH